MLSSSAPVDGTRQVVWMTKSRLEAVVDGVFAIAMTLLVLGINEPLLPHETTSSELLSVLFGMSAEFYHYALAFLILAAFLLVHHKQFARIERMDVNLFWLNILMLLFVCLVPFSTALSGDYSDTQIAVVFFHINLLVIGLLYLAHWRYASHGHRHCGCVPAPICHQEGLVHGTDHSSGCISGDTRLICQSWCQHVHVCGDPAGQYRPLQNIRIMR